MTWTIRKGFESWEIFENDDLWDRRDLPFLKRVKIPQSFESLDELQSWIFAEEQKQIKNAVLRLLSMRNYPSQLLAEKLRMKGFSEKAIHSIVEWAVQRGYVQDGDFLRSMILQEVQKGNGPQAIIWKLLSKRFSRIEIESMLSQLYPREEQIRQIQKLLGQKRDRHKMIARCARRGFSWDEINAALHIARP